MKDDLSRIEEVEAPSPGFCRMKIRNRTVAEKAKPGNFVMVRAAANWDPLLRRPFGILQTEPPHFWLYFKISGRGSRLIANLKPGQDMAVLGPLGNAFPEMPGQNVLLLAGGRGIVPLYFYAQRFAASTKLLLIFGGRASTDITLADQLATLPLQQLLLYSEDGSRGRRGQVVDGLEQIGPRTHFAAAFACGPEGMLLTLQRRFHASSLPFWVSLEALMGCGFGICHSCVVPANGSYLKVCSDGPVFAAEKIAWPT